MTKKEIQPVQEWEQIFPDEKKRRAVKKFIESVSHLERLKILVLIRQVNGLEKLYAFFPTTNLIVEEMEKLGISLDESFAEVDPHDWPVLVEMTIENYREIRRSEPKIKEALAIVLWKKDKRRDMNIPAMLAPFI